MKWLHHAKPSRSAFALALCCLLLPSCYISVHAETYQLTETELTALETNLQTLKTHNQERQKALTEQEALLNQQQTEIEKLQKEIETSKTANEETKKSLAKANEYLSKLEQEEKHKLQVKTRQRNTWAAIAIGTLAWAIIK